MGIFWASPSGVVLSATGPQFLGMRVDDRDYFRKIVSGQDYVISDLLLSRTTGRPSFTISRGIRDEKGALLGIVIAGILPERLDEELGIKRILGGGFALVDTKGMMVYRYPAIDQTWRSAIGSSSILILVMRSKGKKQPQRFMLLLKERTEWSPLPLSPPSAGPLRRAKRRRRHRLHLGSYCKELHSLWICLAGSIPVSLCIFPENFKSY